LTLGIYSGQCTALEQVCPGSNPGGTQSPKIRSESLRLYRIVLCWSFQPPFPIRILPVSAVTLYKNVVLMNWEGGVAINRFATNTNGNCLRSAARNKMSLITLGQASASIHICSNSHYDTNHLK